MTTSRRRFLRQAGLGAGGMWLASRDGNASAGASRPSTRAGDHATLNPWRLEPVDLRRFMRLGVEHIFAGAINRKRGCLPYVRFGLTESPTWARHEHWGSPHMVGRFLDALALCAELIDVPEDDEAINGLRKLLHGCLDNPMGLPFDTLPDPKGRRSGNMHHCREVLQALVGLSTWRGCERSAALARQLVRAMDRATRKTGMYPSHMLYENGWGKPEPGWINYTTGRAIGALVAYYQTTRDPLAMDLAKRFADVNITKTFTPDGGLTKEAGHHLHSTEGTMAGLLYLGAATGEKRYVDTARRLYDVGLKAWRTSWGWAKESRSESPGRGEANNTGDFIESALLLAQCVDPRYYADAERFIRNGLLASQIVNTDWIIQSDKPDTLDYAHSDIRKRARGAFAFTTPNGYHSYNTDLMGGALRALCKAYHAMTTVTGDACRVNLLFTGDAPGLALRSALPEEGKLQLRPAKACNLSVRLPDGTSSRGLAVQVGGKPCRSELKAGELTIGPISADSLIGITFALPGKSNREAAPGWKTPYKVDWLADTITRMHPTEGPAALY